MKKSLLTLLGAGLLLTSCQSDEPFAPVEGGEKQVTFTLNVPGELGTRAGENYNSGDGGWSNTNGNVSYTLVLSAEGHNQTYKKENVAGNTVTFSPTVVLGREYTVTAYAHFSDKAQEDLTNIIETKGINDESKDVYFFTTKENVSKPTINFADGTSYNFDLKRPYAKLRLIAEDYNTTDDTKPKTNITEVTVSYNNEVYTVFNAVEGEFNTKATKSYTKTWNADYYEQGVTSGDKTIFADYIPVNGTDVAPFTIKVKYSGANNEEYERVFAQDIPVRRNALTTLSGNFFTAGAEIKVEVKDAFEGFDEPINFVSVSTATQLQDAIDNAEAGDTIEITGTNYVHCHFIVDKPLNINIQLWNNKNTYRTLRRGLLSSLQSTSQIRSLLAVTPLRWRSLPRCGTVAHLTIWQMQCRRLPSIHLQLLRGQHILVLAQLCCGTSRRLPRMRIHTSVCAMLAALMRWTSM